MEFGPQGPHKCEELIMLKLEELESIRLMDIENFDQNTCAEKMDIGRSTFQRIYKEARRKIADSIINGKRIIIENEEITSCHHNGHCHRHGKR